MEQDNVTVEIDKKEILRATNLDKDARKCLKATEQELDFGKLHTNDSVNENNETTLEIRNETERFLDPGDYLSKKLKVASHFPRDGGLAMAKI